MLSASIPKVGNRLGGSSIKAGRSTSGFASQEGKITAIGYSGMASWPSRGRISDVSFTCFSLEQVPVDVHNALANILALSIRGSVHLEPVPENYPFTWRGIIGRIDHRKVNYVRNLDGVTKSCGAHIAERTILRTAHNPLMFPTLYVLRKP